MFCSRILLTNLCFHINQKVRRLKLRGQKAKQQHGPQAPARHQNQEEDRLSKRDQHQLDHHEQYLIRVFVWKLSIQGALNSRGLVACPVFSQSIVVIPGCNFPTRRCPQVTVLVAVI